MTIVFIFYTRLDIKIYFCQHQFVFEYFELVFGKKLTVICSIELKYPFKNQCFMATAILSILLQCII